MTLDGHIKSGLSATLFLSAFIPSMYSELSDLQMVILLISFAWGNVAPDLIEVRSINLIEHRTYTHYPLFYLIGLAVAYFLIEFSLVNGYKLLIFSFIGYCLGSLMHIICDIPYGKIPYFRVKKGITILRVPFDSILNRIIEHSVLIAFLIGYLYFSLTPEDFRILMPSGGTSLSDGAFE